MLTIVTNYTNSSVVMLTFLIVIGLVCTLCWYIVREQKCERLKQFPVLRVIPVIGNIDLLVGGAFDGESLSFLFENKPNYKFFLISLFLS